CCVLAVRCALSLAVFAAVTYRVVAAIGAHRTFSLGRLVMTVGLVLVAQQGAGAGFGSLMPGFILFGAGSGLMNVPLTNAVMGAAPAARSGIASGLLNASREVAGLLGVTVIGAVLRTVQSSSLSGGARPLAAFVAGYHAGLWVAISVMAVSVVLSYVTLRPRGASGQLIVLEQAPAGMPAMRASVKDQEAIVD